MAAGRLVGFYGQNDLANEVQIALHRSKQVGRNDPNSICAMSAYLAHTQADIIAIGREKYRLDKLLAVDKE